MLHTRQILIHLDHTYRTDRNPRPHRTHQIDQTRQNQGLIHPQGTIHSPLPHSPDHTHTPAEMSSDEEHPDPMTAFMKKFKDTLEDLGANKHINVPQF